ncbi:hypothetical protein C6P46_000370 [Rhodotorula mucilaginosa]|uniref:Checkpoint protein n=1 Tax=Rhodotorula mucilaginosa TaxID=5537 RepID=A0A9P6VVM8_RHOMI|nr:hypothetical protein C6P46_000370 [Rhodotorula mucilaginosa]
MRFKADLRHPQQFARLIASLSPLGKIATLKLKPDAVHLICMADGTKSGVQVWSQIQNSSLFDLDSLRLDSNHHNEIYLEVSLDALSRALRELPASRSNSRKRAGPDRKAPAKARTPSSPSASSRRCVPVPFLLGGRREVELLSPFVGQSRFGKKVEIVQDVAVRVKKAADIEQLTEPLCPAPEVIISLPDLQQLRTVVERLKTVSPFVTIRANNQGLLKFRAEADEANVETEWRNLKRPQSGADDIVAEIEDPSHLFKVTVEAKSLLKFLATYQVASSAIACTFVRVLLSLAEPEWILTRTEGMCGEDTGLCSDHCAIFYVYIGQSKDRVEGGVLTFFVPAVKLDGDDDV